MVSKQDDELGLMEKLQAHETGVLHRAVSVFIFNKKGELLLQKRALSKYHGAKLWTNTCCTHPREAETNENCAHRRLKEEMGFDCDLEERFSFIYKAEVENGLIEHEFDHVFFGIYDGKINPNPAEVEDTTFTTVQAVVKDTENHPEKYTAWFRIILKKHINHLIGMEHRSTVGV